MIRFMTYRDAEEKELYDVIDVHKLFKANGEASASLENVSAIMMDYVRRGDAHHVTFRQDVTGNIPGMGE